LGFKEKGEERFKKQKKKKKKNKGKTGGLHDHMLFFLCVVKKTK